MGTHLAKVINKRINANGKQELVIELEQPVDDFSLQRYSRNDEVKVNVELFDNRYWTQAQRNKIHAIIKDIHIQIKEDYNYEETKERIKQTYCKVKGIEYFSFSNCSVSFARDFISFLLLLVSEQGFQLKLPGRELTEDISYYVYMCLVKRQCVVCDHKGPDCQMHHYDVVGMGVDRTEYDHTKSRLLCLCWMHHQETHLIGLDTFFNKYHVEGIRVNQQDLDQRIKYPREVKNRIYGPTELESKPKLPEIYEKV